MSWYPGKFTRGLPVIPYGPGMPYPDIASLPVGSVVIEGGVVKRKAQNLILSGEDFVAFGVAGVPMTANNVTTSFVAYWNTLSTTVPIVTTSNDGRGLRIQLKPSTNKIGFLFGNGSYTTAELSLSSAISTGWHTFNITLGVSGVYVIVDGVQMYGSSTPIQSYLAARNDIIIGRYDATVSTTAVRQISMTSLSFDGLTAFVMKVKDGQATNVVNGNVGVVTDGSPTGAFEYNLVPA